MINKYYYNKYLKYKLKYKNIKGGGIEAEEYINNKISTFNILDYTEIIQIYLDLVINDIIITSNTEPILTKELTLSNEPKKHIGLSDEVKEKRDKYKEFSKYKSSKN